MSSHSIWIQGWLTGPSLSQWLGYHKKENQTVEESSDELLHTTKEMLKEELVGTILERALIQFQKDSPPDPPSVAPRSGWSYYLYAVCPASEKIALPDEGVDESYPVYALELGPLQALVSKVSNEFFGSDVLQKNLDNAEWHKVIFRRHNAIIGQLSSSNSQLVPLQFCTICDTMDTLKAFLHQNKNDFSATLGLINDKQEWGVEIRCNLKKLRRLTARASDKIEQLRLEIEKDPTNIPRSRLRQIESLIHEETQMVSHTCIDKAHKALASEAERSSVVFQIKALTERQEKQVLLFKGAYLISRAKARPFRATLKKYEASYASLGIAFKLIGPLARFGQEGDTAAALPSPDQIQISRPEF